MGRALKGASKRASIREHARKAEKTLQYMITRREQDGVRARVAPNTDSFNFVIRAWTRCRKSIDVADRAMGALRLLEDYHANVDSTVRPDTKSYAMVMDAIAVRARIKVQRCKRYLQSDPAENGTNEIQLLKNILEYNDAKARRDPLFAAPNTHAYNTLIAAWANLAPIHQHASLEAEKVLQHMTLLKDQGQDDKAPDWKSYLMVMRAWVNTSKPKRGHRVKWWLSKQWNDWDFQGGDLRLQPQCATYNLVIRACTDLGEPVEAELVLEELLQRSESKEFKNLAPNSESFALLIRAWLKVAEKGSSEALTKAVAWLDALLEYEQKETGLVSSVELFTGVLGAARKCASQSPAVLDIATSTFEKLKASHHVVDCLAYSRLLQVGILALSRAESNRVRTAFLRKLVADCQDTGLVSRAFLRALANGPIFYDGWTIEESARMVDELFPDWPFPSAWSRNVGQDGLFPAQEDLDRSHFDISRHGVDPFKSTFR